MAADGKWQLTINTPMGAQQSTLTISCSGGAVSGTQSAATGDERPIEDGKVNGDKISWKASITKPMPMTLEFTATVQEDSMNGSVKLGPFGTQSFRGVRAS
jgi:hypothetical protein